MVQIGGADSHATGSTCDEIDHLIEVSKKQKKFAVVKKFHAFFSERLKFQNKLLPLIESDHLGSESDESQVMLSDVTEE